MKMQERFMAIMMLMPFKINLFIKIIFVYICVMGRKSINRKTKLVRVDVAIAEQIYLFSGKRLNHWLRERFPCETKETSPDQLKIDFDNISSSGGG